MKHIFLSCLLFLGLVSATLGQTTPKICTPPAGWTRCYEVINTNDVTDFDNPLYKGSFREAVDKANDLNSGGTYIRFAVAGEIRLASEISILVKVCLDGSTSPGFSINQPSLKITYPYDDGYPRQWFINHTTLSDIPQNHGSIINAIDFSSPESNITVSTSNKIQLSNNKFPNLTLIDCSEFKIIGNTVTGNIQLHNAKKQGQIGGWNKGEENNIVMLNINGSEKLSIKRNVFSESQGRFDRIQVGTNCSNCKSPPVILDIIGKIVRGKGMAGDSIEVFLDGNCSSSANPLLGITKCNLSGDWSLFCPNLVNQQCLTATATDMQGNTSKFAIYTPPITVSIVSPPVCTGNPNRLQAGTVQGATSYQWDIGNDGTIDQTTPDQYLDYTFPSSGIFVVKVKVVTGNGTYESVPTNISVLPTPGIARVSTTPMVCENGGANTLGGISIQAGGGTAPLIYSINGSNYGSSSSFTGLNAGNYTVYVKDNNSCIANANTTIIADIPTFSGVCAGNVACASGGSTRIQFQVNKNSTSGCTYNYQIKRGSTIYFQGNGTYNTPIIANTTIASEGDYSIAILNDGNCNRCTGIAAPITLTAPKFTTKVSSNMPSSNNTFYTCGNGTAPIKLNTTSLLSPCTDLSTLSYVTQLYFFTGNAYVPIFVINANNEQRDYGVGKYATTSQITPFNCYTDTVFFEVKASDYNLTVIAEQPHCYGDKGKALAMVTGGIAPITYNWQYRGTSFQSTEGKASNLYAGQYILTATDARGCSKTDVATIREGYAMNSVQATVSNCTGLAVYRDTATSSRAPFTFSWKRGYIQTIQVLDTAYYRLHPSEALKYNSRIDTTQSIAHSETQSFSQDRRYFSNSPYLNLGDYYVIVTDRFGCQSTSPLVKVEQLQFSTTYNISMRYVDRPVLPAQPAPPPPVKTAKPIDVTQSLQAIDSKVEACVNKQAAIVAANVLQSCYSKDSLNDYLVIKYTQPSEYHTTLYYYDQAGNLTKTVPPRGVKELANKPTDRNTSPNYKYATTYKYNTLGKVIEENTPDGGMTKNIYDNKGQLRFVQNAAQRDSNTYAYVKYDALGRATENGVHKIVAGEPTFAQLDNITYTQNNAGSFPIDGNREQTSTVYNTPYVKIAYRNIVVSGFVFSIPDFDYITYMGQGQQTHLGNRVSYTRQINKRGDTTSTYYSYDPHGNVSWLAQDIPGYGRNYLGYEYDLLSSKVTKVKYNEYYKDRFFHKYGYDAENRITDVATSTNGKQWDTDARYSYYTHGPLRRIELGEDKLQGIDYTYTLDGKLKAINSPTLFAGHDPGKDGQNEFAPDEFAQTLHYHEGDFVKTGSVFNAKASNTYHLQGKDLYNGNISASSSKHATSMDAGNPSQLTGYKYTYDRLNRIKAADFYPYHNNGTASAAYSEKFSYDANGNILTTKRSANNAAYFDDLNYQYYPNTNRLKRITETAFNLENNKYQDLITQLDSNYRYDASGNLVEDRQQNLRFIWTKDGKLSEVYPRIYQPNSKPQIRYNYDAQGNRVSKEVNVKPYDITGKRQRLPEYLTTSYYVRDAQGNTMAVYERTTQNNNPGTTNGYTTFYRIKEQDIYGSDRLGTLHTDSLMYQANFKGAEYNQVKYVGKLLPTLTTDYSYRTIGQKTYELKDHLGNVRATISDKRGYVPANDDYSSGGPPPPMPVNTFPGGVNGPKEIDVQSYNSYYAFGWSIPGKSYNKTDYRYDFNGKPTDYEIGWQDYGMRMYDARVGRFSSPDPLESKFAFYSPYHFAGNKPIVAVDLDGREDTWIHEHVDYGKKKKITTTRTVNAQVKQQIIDMLGYDPDPNNEGGVLVSSEVSGDGKTYYPGHNMTKPVIVEGTRKEKSASWQEPQIFREGSSDGTNQSSLTKNEITATANFMDISGNATIVIGYGLLFTPAAPVGVGLILAGEITALTGDAIQFGQDINDGKFIKAGINFGFNLLGRGLGNKIGNSAKFNSNLEREIIKTSADIKLEIGQKTAETLIEE